MQDEQTKSMSKTGILFPHQLFEQNSLVSTCGTIYLVEEWLYFKQYNFHKQKIAFHRASMKFYESYLQSKKVEVVYIDSFNALADIRKLIPYLKKEGVDAIEYIDTTDDWLEQRIQEVCKTFKVEITKIRTPLFLNSSEELANYFSGKKRMYQTDFYKHQRLSRNILLEKDQKPVGGKWTYDDENRVKYPKGKIPPKTDFLKPNRFYEEAVTYTEKYFPDNYGKLNSEVIYPT
ncbi:MAG: cryptochrome/photolyase family protein, partial [Ginsengibacter sp.]